MIWLAGGVLYSLGYVALGWMLADHAGALLWFRGLALLLPPVSGIVVIALRRRSWSGCQWLFWATVALGLAMSSIGLVGWTVDELLLARETSWLGWYSVFALFGGIAPLFALLAQPHRGAREGATASTAVDIAGIGVMAGFLYSHFVVGPDLVPLSAQTPSLSLLLLCEFQQLVVFAGMTGAAVVARHQPWGATYRRLALGFLVQFIILTVSSLGILQGLYRTGFVYDLVWILPFAFFPWAAATAPGSTAEELRGEAVEDAPSRPWVVFGALALTPVLDFGLRQAMPLGSLDAFRDLFTAITVFSVLPLLMARLAVERGEARSADGRRRLLAAAIEQSDDQIAIMSPDGRIEHANRSFCRAAGLGLAELAGVSAADLLAPQSRSQMDVVLDSARTAGIWRGTLVRTRPGGGTSLTASAIVGLSEGASGTVQHLVSVERDVTHETRMREQLIHSERLAAVGQLVSGVAHELNNPLQSVVGFTELLIEAEAREETRADLQHVRDEANRAARIIRNLLSFVRRSSTEREPADINEIVASTVALREYDLRAGGMKIDVQYAADLPAVEVNREEIQQVLLNLILNAEQAIRGAGRPGELRVRTFAQGGLVVEVEDDGPGVPEALAGQIFEPFFSTKEVGQGTGLGLSIALGIAESHGGTLTLVPLTRGACFRLTLPAGGAEVALESHPRRHVWSDITGRRALVADDQPGLRELLQRLLTKRGFAVEAVGDGQAAADVLARGRFDVIFCDVQMPDLDGMSLYEILRRRQPHLLDAFIFMSGDELNTRLRWLVDTARAPLLPKPFTSDQLDGALAQVLSQRVG